VIENDLGDDGAVRLAGALRVNTTLNKLVLASDGIKNAGAAALADMLKVPLSCPACVCVFAGVC
jgi:hypothetical protein